MEVKLGEARYVAALVQGHPCLRAGGGHRTLVQQVHGRALHDGACRRGDLDLLRRHVPRRRKLQQAPHAARARDRAARLQDGVHHRPVPGAVSRAGHVALGRDDLGRHPLRHVALCGGGIYVLPRHSRHVRRESLENGQVWLALHGQRDLDSRRGHGDGIRRVDPFDQVSAALHQAFGWYRIVLGIIVVLYLYFVGDPVQG